MTDEEFLDWSERHCHLFGINFDADIATVTAWEAEFQRFGYEVAELQAATTAMAALTEPVRLSSQLAWLNEFIRRLRNRIGRNRKPREPEQEFEFDRKWYRQEVERMFPSHRWTVSEGKKRKAVKS